MKIIIRDLYRFMRDCLILLVKFLIYPIPKNYRLILFSSWFGDRYADNTMYLYEYLLEKGDY